MAKKKIAKRGPKPKGTKRKAAKPKKAKRKVAKRKGAKPTASTGTKQGEAMTAPASGVTVRMYRQGHGDCFLLAFRNENGKPFYLLIDCGMKRGSQIPKSNEARAGEKPVPLCTITEVAENIRDSTGGHLDLVVITHEHEDHVSGFLSEEEIFQKLKIDELWLAWTEDDSNPEANRLRTKYKDTLIGLVATAEQFNGLATRDQSDTRILEIVNSLLGFELSDNERSELAIATRSLAAAKDDGARTAAARKVETKIDGLTNKMGMKVIKDVAKKKRYHKPSTKPLKLRELKDVRFFVLGPPENEAALRDMNPKEDEAFELAASQERSFMATFADLSASQANQPFAARYRRYPAHSLGGESDEQSTDDEEHEFFKRYYLEPKSPEDDDQDWRRIDGDWLRPSEQFALRMNNFINNTSLVLAIELPKTKKVLLFVGDAQRGNWVSWATLKETSPNHSADGTTGTVTDLLGRTVFYKCGHHGSHNATMNKGGLQDMAAGEFEDQFVAMIPAHQKWAEAVKPAPWRHPLESIYKALLRKAKGRVFVMDRELGRDRDLLSANEWLPDEEWNAFLNESTQCDLYYEFTVNDQ